MITKNQRQHLLEAGEAAIETGGTSGGFRTKITEEITEEN